MNYNCLKFYLMVLFFFDRVLVWRKIFLSRTSLQVCLTLKRFFLQAYIPIRSNFVLFHSIFFFVFGCWSPFHDLKAKSFSDDVVEAHALNDYCHVPWFCQMSDHVQGIQEHCICHNYFKQVSLYPCHMFNKSPDKYIKTSCRGGTTWRETFGNSSYTIV